MAHPGDGYVSDIEYIAGYYPNQAPAHLDAVCLLNGIAPPDRRDGFAWCELGCGQGLTANLVAAAHPEAVVHGVDYLPAHIARARADAAAAGIANATYHEAAFADATEDRSLPAFDYVTLHGVYSWVGPQVQADIVRFLERRVKPGGVVLVSYNVLPGWQRIAPLQRLLRAHAEAAPAGVPSDRRVRDALAFARALQAADAAGLAGVDIAAVEAPMPGRGEAQHAAYLAHEYLNADWRPLLHADVACDLAAAGLVYAGSARPFHNMPELVLSDAQRAVLGGIADPAARESLADYCTGQMLRWDVFVRGPRRLAPAERDKALRAVPLALIHQAVALPHRIEGGGRTVTLEPAVYGPILGALGEGVRTIDALLDLPELRGRPDAPSPSELFVALSGCDFAWACGRPAGTASDTVRRFNRLQAAEALEGRHAVAAFAAGAGLGVAMERPGAALYLLLTGAAAPPPEALPARMMELLGETAPILATADPATLQAQAVRRLQAAQAAEASIRLLPAFWRRIGCL